jgi:hypothetical protein
VAVDGDAGPLLDRLLEALERDDRVSAPVCGYDYDAGRVECTFQFELADADSVSLVSATGRTRGIFDDALHTAGLLVATSAIAVVAGEDPDQLP